MAWERINGHRYFYETLYTDGKRTRRCWGNGPAACQAAARVQQDDDQEAEDIERVRALKRRDQDLDERTAAFNTAIKSTIDEHLYRAGFHYTRGQWRQRKS